MYIFMQKLYLCGYFHGEYQYDNKLEQGVILTSVCSGRICNLKMNF